MPTLAVVPIFVNAGAAILPAILAGAVSMVSLLLKPRELLHACRRRPVAAISVVMSLAAAIWLGSWAATVRPANAAKAKDANAVATAIDWSKIALQVIRCRQAGQFDAAATMPAAAVGLGRDFARCAYDGCGSPVELQPRWEFKLEDAAFLSSPAVVGGKVYAATCQLDVTGKYGSLVCVDARSGQKIWQADGDGSESFKPFFSSPALTQDGRYLLIGQGLHDDKDCCLLCFEAATGTLRWRLKTPLHIEGSPAIAGDMVVAGAGAIEGADRKPTTHPGLVVAVRISDGAELWRYELADPESSPAIGPDGTVYIGSGFNGSAVVALRGQSDAELKAAGLDRLIWRAGSPFPVTGAVSLAGELVIVGGGNGDYVYASPNPAGVVLALDRQSGQVRWQSKMDDAVLGAVAVADGRAICPVRNGEVVALDLRNGQRLWHQRISGNSPVLAGPAVAGRFVYAVSRDGYLAVLDAASGQLLEKHHINDDARPGAMGLSLSSPTVAGGCLFVGSETGGLRCFTGQLPIAN